MLTDSYDLMRYEAPEVPADWDYDKCRVSQVAERAELTRDPSVAVIAAGDYYGELSGDDLAGELARTDGELIADARVDDVHLVELDEWREEAREWAALDA